MWFSLKLGFRAKIGISGKMYGFQVPAGIWNPQKSALKSIKMREIPIFGKPHGKGPDKSVIEFKLWTKTTLHTFQDSGKLLESSNLTFGKMRGNWKNQFCCPNHNHGNKTLQPYVAFPWLENHVPPFINFMASSACSGFSNSTCACSLLSQSNWLFTRGTSTFTTLPGRQENGVNILQKIDNLHEKFVVYVREFLTVVAKYFRQMIFVNVSW